VKSLVLSLCFSLSAAYGGQAVQSKSGLTLAAVANQASAIKFSPDAIGGYRLDARDYAIVFEKSDKLSDGTELTCRFKDESITEREVYSSLVLLGPARLVGEKDFEGPFHFSTKGAVRRILGKTDERVRYNHDCDEWGVDGEGLEECTKVGKILSSYAYVSIPVRPVQIFRKHRYLVCQTQPVSGEDRSLEITFDQFKELLGGLVEFIK